MDDYYEKYMKYKNRYLNLKHQMNIQEGGANNPKIDLTRAENNDIQKRLGHTMIIADDAKPFNEKVMESNLLYSVLLKGLMTQKPNDEINLDFLNLISALPYDGKGLFDIISKPGEDPNYQFANVGKLLYKIDKILVSGDTGGGDFIIRLIIKDNHKIDNGYPKTLIMKLFSINYENYKNYTPLIFTEIFDHIDKVTESGTRYYAYDTETFNKLLFDKGYDQYFTNKVNGAKTFISVGDFDNFKNEMVQNIIIRTILESTEYTTNLINFYNFLYVKVDGKYYGAIIMEEIKGTLFDDLEKTPEYIANDALAGHLDRYLKTLAYLKSNQYRFTHTDLKLKNVFVRDDGTLLIADLDKSSITYNKIRFFNGAWIHKSLDLFKHIASRDVIKEDGNFLYADTSKTREILSIEFEQLIFRYSFFPFVPYFDYLTLYIDLKILTKNATEAFDKSETTKLFDQYQISGKSIKDITIVIGQSLFEIDHSDFGQLIFHNIIINKIGIPINIQSEFIKNGQKSPNKIVNDIKLIVQKSTVLNTGPKLLLTPQLSISTITTYRKSFYQSSYEWLCQSDRDSKLYNIFYTGNTSKKIGEKIFKVNRYTYSKYLYEYVDSTDDIMAQYIDKPEVHREQPNEGAPASSRSISPISISVVDKQ